MARRFGSSTSFLVRSAQAAQERTAAYNDQIAAQAFDLSDKSEAAFQQYNSYLQGRLSTVAKSDPSKAISIQNKATSAQRSYFGSEITKASIAVMEGGASEDDKLAKLGQLYQAAEQVGDANLAQRLRSQYDSQAIKIQNQQITALNEARTASEKVSTHYLKAQKTYASDLLNKRSAINPDTGQEVPGLKFIQEEIKKKGLRAVDQELMSRGTTLAKTLMAVVERSVQAYDAAGEEDKADNIRNGETKIQFAPGFSITADQLVNEIQANATGRTGWGQSTTVNGEHTISSLVYSGANVGKTVSGQSILVKAQDAAPSSTVDREEIQKQLSAYAKDKKLVYKANEDGTYTITDNNGASYRAIPRNNNELFFSKGFDEQGNEIIGKVDLKNQSISDVSSQEIDAIIKESKSQGVDKEFNQAVAAGYAARQAPKSGLTGTNFNASELSGQPIKSFGNLNAPAPTLPTLQGYTSAGSLIQSAQNAQNIQKTLDAIKLQSAAPASVVQPAANLNLNQTVFPKDTLTVAPVAPAPRISVTPITAPSVKVATPVDNTKVTVAGPQYVLPKKKKGIFGLGFLGL